ncbi:MAG: hypothetical protein OXM54_17860 [Acidimicrobiaceae bacterium]|nr:hypothetical protein [Acidimicrobiaceae bacterium]
MAATRAGRGPPGRGERLSAAGLMAPLDAVVLMALVIAAISALNDFFT